MIFCWIEALDLKLFFDDLDVLAMLGLWCMDTMKINPKIVNVMNVSVQL